MYNYSIVVEEALEMLELSNEKFNESQRVRMDYILYAKQSGDKFLLIKKALAKATRYNPITLEGLGTYTSFNNFLEEYVEPKYGIQPSTVKDHVKLAECWEIVLSLGMQDKSNTLSLSKSMRVARTLKIIRWYEKHVDNGVPADQLTLERYWEEEENKLREAEDPSVLTKKQLTQRVQDLEMQLGIARTTISQLEKELARYKQEAKPLPAALFVR